MRCEECGETVSLSEREEIEYQTIAFICADCIDKIKQEELDFKEWNASRNYPDYFEEHCWNSL